MDTHTWIAEAGTELRVNHSSIVNVGQFGLSWETQLPSKGRMNESIDK